MGFGVGHSEVDGALLSHPLVAEAVAFGAPDEKYGEVVAAAVVLSRDVPDHAAIIKDIQRQTATRLASFKVRALVPLAPKLPLFSWRPN